MEVHDNGLLINPERINQTMAFMGPEEEEAFKKECERNPEWEWANLPIEYKFNEFGHRTKSLKDLSPGFMMTFGCSYTEGVGLRHEDTWSWKVAEARCTDVYNAAAQGTGCDVACYQASQWIKNGFPIPHLVIVQWPAHTRKSFVLNKDDHFGFKDMAEDNGIDGKWYRRRYIMDEGECIWNNRLWFDHFNLLWKSVGVPVLNFTWEMDYQPILRSPYQVWPIRCKNGSMKARDLMHDGIEWHQETANKILPLLDLPDFTNKI